MNWIGGARARAQQGNNNYRAGAQPQLRRTYQLDNRRQEDGSYGFTEHLENRRPCPLLDFVRNNLPHGEVLALQLSHQMEIDYELTPRPDSDDEDDEVMRYGRHDHGSALQNPRGESRQSGSSRENRPQSSGLSSRPMSSSGMDDEDEPLQPGRRDHGDAVGNWRGESRQSELPPSSAFAFCSMPMPMSRQITTPKSIHGSEGQGHEVISNSLGNWRGESRQNERPQGSAFTFRSIPMSMSRQIPTPKSVHENDVPMEPDGQGQHLQLTSNAIGTWRGESSQSGSSRGNRHTSSAFTSCLTPRSQQTPSPCSVVEDDLMQNERQGYTGGALGNEPGESRQSYNTPENRPASAFTFRPMSMSRSRQTLRSVVEDDMMQNENERHENAATVDALGDEPGEYRQSDSFHTPENRPQSSAFTFRPMSMSLQQQQKQQQNNRTI